MSYCQFCGDKETKWRTVVIEYDRYDPKKTWEKEVYACVSCHKHYNKRRYVAGWIEKISFYNPQFGNPVEEDRKWAKANLNRRTIMGLWD